MKKTEELKAYEAPEVKLLHLQTQGILKSFSVELDWELEEGEEDAITKI